MRFRERLEEFYTVLKDKPIKEIMSIVRKEAPEINISDSTLSRYLYQIRNESEEVLEVIDEVNWNVINDNYIIEISGQKKIFSIELVDDIFLYYSKRGYNYTRQKLMQRFGIKPKTLDQIRRVFNLSKDCDIISPYTKKNNTPEDAVILIENKIDKVLESGEITTQKYQEKLARAHRKGIESLKLDEGWKNEVISELLATLPKGSEINVLRDSSNEISEVTIVLADIHAGGKHIKSKLSDRWDMDMVKEKLLRVSEVANSFKAAKVNLVILGDLVETISGVNHPDSWKGIEGGMFGSNIIIQTNEFLINNLINKIVNLSKIVATGGNHDRLQSSNKNADTGATDLIFYMIQQRLKLMGSDIEVIYDPVIVSFKTKAFGFIGVHGDKGLHRRELSYITQKFAVDRDQYQFVFSAHLHSFFCKNGDDQEFGRRVTIPAIITGNDYSDVEIGKASKSGCISVIENQFNEPQMTVHNI